MRDASPSAACVGAAAGALTLVLWLVGALIPPLPLQWTALDLRWYFFPLYDAFYGALRAGTPMFWNPYQLCGMPVVGTLQAGFFYPPHVLYLLLPTPWALAASTALHIAFAAGAAAAFARRGGLSVAAAILAGMIFVSAGTIRHWQLWPYLLESSAWIPLGAIAVLDLTGGRPARGALLLALSTGMGFLAGGVQATVFGCYAWAALLLARLALGGEARIAPVRAIGAAAGALVAGGLLGAVALLPAFELAQDAVRHTSRLSIEFLYPLGIPTARDVAMIWLSSGRVAVLSAAALVPFALGAGVGWLPAWAVTLGGFAVLLSLGPATPAMHLYDLLPLLGWFRMPYRLLLLAQLCLGVLAGLGLDVLARRVSVRALGAIVVTAVLAATAYEASHWPRPAPPLPYREADAPWTPELRDAYVRLADMAGHDRVWTFSPTVFAGSLPPKLATLAAVRSIEDYEPLALRRQSEFFVFFAEGATIYWDLGRAFEGRTASLKVPRGREPAATRWRLLDLAATRFVLMPSHTFLRPDVVAFARDVGLSPRPAPGPGLALLENPHALPRAFVTYRARRAPVARELLALISQQSFDPLVESFVERDADLPTAPDAPARGSPATIVRDDPHRVEVEATLAAPGLVVLADTFAPGWTATVDGVPMPILATNHLFRGVEAPAGTHRVVFAYRPHALLLGAAVSAAAAGALALLAWAVATKRLA